MRIEYKRASSVDIKSEGTIRALVAVTGNVDRSGDRIVSGAFANTLQEWKSAARPIPLVLCHNWSEPGALLGEVTNAEETSEGLVVDASLDLEFPPVAHVFRRMQAKSLSEFSIGFIAREAAFVEMDGELIREIRDIELLECGPCVAGMNPETGLLDLKALEKEDIIDVLVERLAKKIQANSLVRIPDEQKAVVSAWTTRLAKTR